MSGLLYFISGKNDKLAYDDAAAVGLGYAFEVPGRGGSPNWTPVGVCSGPDETSGVVLASAAATWDSPPGYYPDKQEWRRIGKGPAWVGMYCDDKPRPEDLVRAEMLPGHAVRLADDQEWTIPVARGANEQDDALSWHIALPSAVSVNDAGEWVRAEVIDKYQVLWAVATRWWEELSAALSGSASSDDSGIRFDFAGLLDAALLALATNYRVTRIEVGLLGLFNEQCATEILKALVDWPTIQQWLKKKRAAPPTVS
jgi:hypothetical protein